MKKFIVDLLVVVMPVLSILIVVNYIGDPAHKFDSGYEQRIVTLMNGRHGVTNVDNCDERKLKRLLIESNKGKHFDFIIFGSSRCMTMSQHLTGANLFDMGVSGATLQDFLSLLELCKENHITYDNVIVSIDPGLLNSKNQDKRWLTNKEYFEKITGQVVVESPQQELPIRTLLSGSYFQSSILSLLKNKGQELAIAQKDENVNQTNFPDGTITYGEAYRCAPQSQIDNMANNNLRQEFYSFDTLSDDYIRLFNLFLSKVTEGKQSVTFVTFPYLEGYYKRLMSFQGIREQEKYLTTLAKEKHYLIFGSLNPACVGVTNKDFYDELHLRRETIALLCKKYMIFGTSHPKE